MLPYLIAGVIGYGISKLFEDNKAPKYNDGGLIAPNGKPSNLTPEQYKLVRTKAFKDWFGDWQNDPANASKVVDENGEPLVLNHSTRKNQKEDGSYEDYFDIDSWLQERGNYLFSTPNSSVNPIFLSRKGKYALSDDIWQIKFFANIKNLFDTDNKNHLKKLQEYTIKTYSKYGDFNEMAEDLYGGGYETFEVDYKIGEKRNKWENSGSIPALISEMGYDAYINNDENVIVVFDRNKLKLADGTNTTFDANNPDIRFDEGGLIAPNGKPSNLTPEQYKLVRTKAFKDWFGDWENDPANASKVVDENGEPLVVFHGTNEKFNIFNKKGKGNRVLGYFFTTDKDFSKNYGESKLYFLNIKKIKNFNSERFDSLNTRENAENNYWQLEKDKLLEEMYNGVLIDRNDFFADINFVRKDYVAFEPNQIKLADGTNTTFDSNNPDIRFMAGGQVLNLNKIRKGQYEAKSDKIEIYLTNPKVLNGIGTNKWQLIIEYSNDIIVNQWFDTMNEALKTGAILLSDFLDSNNTETRFMAGGNVPKTSKDEYGNWSGEYLGNKFSIYKLNEGWKFSFTYYSPLIQSEKNYFSSDDFSPFKTKKDAVNTLLEKIKEINEENESIIAQRKSKFNDGGLIKLNDFNKKVKGELKKSDYDYAKTIDEKRKVITFLYAHEYYQINNIIPLAEPDDDIIYWQLVSINGKEYIIGIYLTFHDFDNRLKITDSEITFYDVDYNELPNPIKMEEGGLIAPNGKPSNLTPEQYKLVRTPEFKAWFGDWENDPENSSKVVDENGEPLVVYRGDSSKTNIFKGITFFSSNDYVAGSYSNEDAIPEYKVFLNIRNPLNLLGGNELRRTPNSARILGSDPNVVNIFKEAILNLPNDYTISVGYGDKWDKKTLYELVIKNYEGIEYINYNNQSASWEAIIKYAKTKGFDGVFMNDESQDRLIQFQFSQITFEPEQIKLADGTNTTFDGNNPDIRYADGGYIRNIKKLYTEDDSDVYGGDFGQAGGINWRINPETNFLYLMGIGRNNRGENSVKSKGEGSRALAYLFELYPEVDKIYFEIEGEEGAWKFYKKIGAEEEGGGKITENTYNAELSRTALRNYFVKKNNPDIRFDGGGNLK